MNLLFPKKREEWYEEEKYAEKNQDGIFLVIFGEKIDIECGKRDVKNI